MQFRNNFAVKHPTSAKWVRKGGLPYFCAYMIAMVTSEGINFPIQCNFVFRSKVNLANFIYNIGKTVLNGGVTMVIFFINKIIFPESGK